MKPTPPQSLDDVLLNQQDPTIAAHERAERQAVEEAVANARHLLVDIGTLEHHHGWQRFMAFLREDELSLLARLEQANDPTTQSRLVGMHLHNRAMQAWLKRTADDATSTIKESP